MIKYKNPFYSPKADNSAPEYEGEEYLEYRGFLIFERVKGRIWDVVRDGTVITMRAGIRGAKSFIDDYFIMMETGLII